MTTLAAILIWLMIGDLLSALRPWEDGDEDWWALWVRVSWPIQIWWIMRRLISDWRLRLYNQTKHM